MWRLRGQSMWRSPFSAPACDIKGVEKKAERWHRGTFWRERGTRSEMLIEKRRKSIKRAPSDWQLAKVFSVEVSRTAQLLSLSLSPPLSRPRSLFLLLFLSLSLRLIHHLPLHPSSHCRLLLNVSPNSPNISLTFHSIVPPLQLSLARPPTFSSQPLFFFFRAEMHSLPAI